MTTTQAPPPTHQKWRKPQHETQRPMRHQQRERGTLKNTLPGKSAVLVILSIVGLASAALATLLVCYSQSFPSEDVDNLRDASDLIIVAKMMGLAMSGSASTLVGIVYGDSLCHCFGFGIALFFIQILSNEDVPSSVNVDIVKSSLKAASPPLLVSILASLHFTQSLLRSLDFSSLIGAHALIIPIISSLAYLFILAPQIAINSSGSHSASIALTPICIVSILTLTLFLAYYQNRSHKNGCLLTPSMKSHAFISSIAIVSSSILPLLLLPDSKTNTAILPSLTLLHTSSVITLLLAHFFASTADVWYAVGSGQFQMISLDAAGMILYFIFPAVVLYFRFLEKYGEILQNVIGVLRKNVVGVLGPASMEDTMAAVVFIGALSAIHALGVPLLNSLCPLGGYLYSRSYIHGRPNTKKVALSLNFSDVPKVEGCLVQFLNKITCADDASVDEADRSASANTVAAKKDDGNPTVVLNVHVTTEEIEKYPSQLKELVKMGHQLVLSPASTYRGVQNIFRGNEAAAYLKAGYDSYSKVIGEPPKWYFAESSDGMGRHPSLLREASDLGMKVSYWSTVICVDGLNLRADQLDSLKSDVRETNGGSIIFVTLSEKMKTKVKSSEDGDESRLISSIICQILDSLSSGEQIFSLVELSNVAKDDATMIL